MYTLRICLLLCLALWLAIPNAVTKTQAAHNTYDLDHHGETAFFPPHDQLSLSSNQRAISSYMIGSIALQVIFVESDGSQVASTEDWTHSQQENISAQITQALEWWQQQLPLAKLQFKVETRVINTGYEPIELGVNNEKLWISDVLAKQGFLQTNYFEQAYASANALRDKHQTDWASTIFIVNSTNDKDGRFADGLFAYAYIQGPFMVITSKAGSYGETLLAPVIAHEFAHIFGALDQYESAKTPCTQRSGYLYGASSNSQWQSCGSNQPSIMIDPLNAFRLNAIDESALVQIGYTDHDHNGRLDLLDTKPIIAASLLEQGGSEFPQLWVSASDQGLPSLITAAVSLNHIARIEIRIDEGEWWIVEPSDGTYDSDNEQAVFTLPLYKGQQLLEIRAINSIGNSSPIQHFVLTSQANSIAPHFGVTMPEYSNSYELTAQAEGPTGSMYQISDDLDFEQAAWIPIEQQATFDLPDRDGEYEFFIRFRDAQGIESFIFRRLVIVDRQAPTGVAYMSVGSETQIEFALEDSLSAPVLVTLSLLDQQIELDYQISLKLDCSVSDVRQIQVQDAAGNRSEAIPLLYRSYLPLSTN